MAYSNAWDETTPLGTAAASSIDNIMRQDKVNLRERMNSIVVDWTADPIVPKTSVGRVLLLGPETLIPASSSVSYAMPTDSTALALAFSGIVNIPASDGWEIRKIEVLVDKGAAPSVSISAVLRVFATSIFGGIVIGPVVASGSGTQMLTVYSAVPGAAGIIINNQMAGIYFAAGAPGGTWNFFGARVTYDVRS